jgi:hypothetical protein
MRHAKPMTATLLAVAAIATAAPVALAAPPDRHGSGGGGGAAAPAASRLPASWPKDVPVPPGQVTGTNVAPGHAVVQLIVRGSARVALHTTVAFYHARGWKGRGPGVHKGSRRIVVVSENRDHSATKSFVVISVTL